MYNCYAFRWLTIFKRHPTTGWSTDIDQPLKFHRSKHIIQFAIVQLRNNAWVKVLEAGRQDNRTRGQVEVAIFHVMVDGAALASRQAFQTFRTDATFQA